MGFVALGLAAGTTTGLQAALFANVAHGIISALLFFLVGGLKERWGSVDLAVARPALRETSPRLGFAARRRPRRQPRAARPGRLLGRVPRACTPRGRPPTDRPRALFVGCAVVGAIGAALAAAYCPAGGPHRLGRVTGPTRRPPPPRPTPAVSSWLVLAVLVLAVVVLGVLPGPLLRPSPPTPTADHQPGA